MTNNILNSEHWEQEHKNHTISLIYFSLVFWSSVGYLGQHSTGSVECGREEGTKQLLMVSSEPHFGLSLVWFRKLWFALDSVAPRAFGLLFFWFGRNRSRKEPLSDGYTRAGLCVGKAGNRLRTSSLVRRGPMYVHNGGPLRSNDGRVDAEKL